MFEVIVGAKGTGNIVVLVTAEVGVIQPAEFVLVIEKEPVLYTVILCVTAPVLHKYVEESELVKVTLSPVQNDNGLLAEIVGVAGVGKTVNTVLVEVAVHPLTSETVTLYAPVVVTVIVGVLFPLDQL